MVSYVTLTRLAIDTNIGEAFRYEVHRWGKSGVGGGLGEMKRQKVIKRTE